MFIWNYVLNYSIFVFYVLVFAFVFKAQIYGLSGIGCILGMKITTIIRLKRVK